MFSRLKDFKSITECYRVLQNITGYFRLLQSVTEYYRVFLAHLLGPISGLVWSVLVPYRGIFSPWGCPFFLKSWCPFWRPFYDERVDFIGSSGLSRLALWNLPVFEEKISFFFRRFWVTLVIRIYILKFSRF